MASLSVAAISNYDEKIVLEKQAFEADKYDPKSLVEDVTSALSYSHDAFHAKIRRALGKGPWDYIVDEVNSRPGASVLSIGSGPCGLEISLAKRFTGKYDLTCLDLNEALLSMGKAKAESEGIEIKTLEQDANFLKLPQNYDVILAHASLHHFIEFEHIFQELHDHLNPEGVFIAFEHVPRNGMLLWPQTRELVDRLFAVLPVRYRRERTSEGTIVHSHFPVLDCSVGGFECIRSEDIVPLLERFFQVKAEVPGHAFTRRFVDGAFGENYDLSREEDRLILDLLIEFDDVLTSRSMLRAESVFMVLGRKG
jgi:SAM-dependent methyltransferase